MPLAVASIWLEADITHAVAPSCRCAAGVLPFSTRLEPTGGQKRAVPECCMQSAPWKVDRPMMPAGLARMHVHDIVTTDERARQGHPRGRKSGRGLKGQGRREQGRPRPASCNYSYGSLYTLVTRVVDPVVVELRLRSGGCVPAPRGT